MQKPIISSLSDLNAKPRLLATPLILWCLAIFLLSSVPGNMYPQVRWEHADKLVHIALYFWGGVFAWVYFHARQYRFPVATAIIFGSFYGLSDEIHQLFVPRRSFSVYDWIADTIGVIIGVTVIFELHRRYTASKNLKQKKVSHSAERMEAS